MAIVLEGDGTITGVTTFTTPLDDIKFDSINVTGIATAGTFQAGTGVSMASPRAQNIALFTNNVEGLTLDDSGRLGIGISIPNQAADANNVKVVNAGIITANQYYGNQLTAVGSRVTGVGTFENGLNITGNITNGLNVSAGIATFQAVSGTTGTFSAAVSGTTGTFSGDVSIADKIVHTGDTDTAIRFPAADTITAETGGSERVRIDSSGRVLIGTTTEGNSVADDLTVAGSGDSGITIRSGSSSEGSLMFSDATSGSAEYAGWVCYNHNSNFMRFYTNETERLRIAANGQIYVANEAGTIDTTVRLGEGTRFQLSGLSINDGF